jgi:glycosyltransferase involved in cell wall biosynthesis
MPRVSLIMSVHNGRRFLPATMRSIARQTMGDYEFVVVDDGSTDHRIRHILRQHADGDGRIKLFMCPHRGQTAALNHGLSMARAPLIARIDADDLAHPDRLAKQVEFMESHPSCVLLGTWHDVIDHRGRPLITMRPDEDDASLQQAFAEGRCAISHSSAMFRRDVTASLKGYDERYHVAQDLDLWLRLAERGEVACLQESLVGYRVHPRSMSERFHAQQDDESRAACVAAAERRGTACAFHAKPTTTCDRAWRARRALTFGWWAWQRGDRATSRGYAFRAAMLSPLSMGAYRLLYASFKSTSEAPTRVRAVPAVPVGAGSFRPGGR